jgi:hypothetical protein
MGKHIVRRARADVHTRKTTPRPAILRPPDQLEEARQPQAERELDVVEPRDAARASQTVFPSASSQRFAHTLRRDPAGQVAQDEARDNISTIAMPRTLREDRPIPSLPGPDSRSAAAADSVTDTTPHDQPNGPPPDLGDAENSGAPPTMPDAPLDAGPSAVVHVPPRADAPRTPMRRRTIVFIALLVIVLGEVLFLLIRSLS